MDFRDYVRAQLPPLHVRREPEIVDEIAEHLAELYDEARRDGLSHEAALARARGAMPVRVERARFSSPLAWLTDLRIDVRYGLRTLGQTPGFALAVVLTLALGIGANTVIFTAIDAVLLRPPAIADPDRVVQVFSATADGRSPFSTTSHPNYVDIRDQQIFDGLVAYANIQLALDVQGTSERVSAQIVSGNYFDVLGVPLALGRGFAPDEDRGGAPRHVVVVADAAWRRYFAANPSLVGRTITLNGVDYAVIGIAPRGYTGPILGQAPQFWVPMALQPEVRPPSAGLRRALRSSNMLDARGPGWINMLGRLSPDSSIDGAMAALGVLAGRLEDAHPDSNRGRRFNVMPLGEAPGVRTASRPLLRALAGAVVLVLLIACANVASLLIVRALSRQRDVAVRLAIGASRWRLVRQWIAEALLLSILGGAGAVLIAWWATPLLYTLGIPDDVDLSPTPRVWAFTFLAAVVSGLLFGSISVAHVVRRGALSAVREHARGATDSLRAARLRSTFVVVQVALSVVLLVGAGLFLRTLQNAYSVSLGYDIDRTLVTEVNLDLRGYAPEAGQLAYARILEGVRQIPGVASAAAARVVVLGGGARTTSVSIDGQPLAQDDANAMDVRTNVVSHGYLDTLRIPLLMGRDFSAADHAQSPRVAIVSRSLAARVWPSANPVGRTLIASGVNLEVIGVVPDTVYTTPIEAQPLPFFYSLLAQAYESAVTLHIRTATDSTDALPAIRRVVRDVDPLLSLSTPTRMRDVLERALGDQRLMARLVASFGALALALAVIGLYGVLAHIVASRQTEIGVRMALGANPSLILRMVLLQGVRLVIAGAVVGLVLALAATKYIESQLFGVGASDPLTLITALLLLVVIGTLACLIPARRAVRVEPTAVLRS